MVDNSLINITAAATVCSDSIVIELVIMVDNVMTGCLVKVSTYGP
jgi:hypothetical protein